MATKPKPSGPRWAIHNENFPLTEAENEIVNRHIEVWREFVAGGKPLDTYSLEYEWASFKNGAEDGDADSLALMLRFGNIENFVRYRRAEQLGRSRKFSRENCGLFAENHPIAARMRAVFEKLLAQYREAGQDERRLLGLPAVVNDDATALMERIIGELFKVEQYHPTGFELLQNHVGLIQIEEEGGDE